MKIKRRSFENNFKFEETFLPRKLYKLHLIENNNMLNAVDEHISTFFKIPFEEGYIKRKLFWPLLSFHDF